MTDNPAETLIGKLRERGLFLVAAESCTAGLVADMLARVSGASDVFWGSFVTYTAGAKTAMLGVPAALIAEHGAVSREVACAMATGALAQATAAQVAARRGLAVAVTGLAGPLGDGSPVPVGTVWIAVATTVDTAQVEARVFHYTGERNEVRRQAAQDALTLALGMLVISG
jgi:PncC family amidohydrolase